MKNSIFNILNLEISRLPKIGPTLNKFLSRLIGGNHIFDLLLHLPIRFEQILMSPRLFECQDGQIIITKVKVESHHKPQKSRQPYKVICYTPSGYLTLVFFKIFPSQIAKMPIGEEIIVKGTLQKNAGENQIHHPEEILKIDEANKLPKLNIIYPLTAAISQKFLNQKIREVLNKIKDDNIEWINPELLKKENWPNFATALKDLHYFNQQNSQKAQENFNQARKRIAFDELLAWQIATLLTKGSSKPQKKIVEANNNLSEKFLQNLPFKPTKAQIKVVDEIKNDIFSSKKMLRLLQGDVGSGKTIVAIISALHKIAQNGQVCVIAPTLVLAKQHFEYFSKFLSDFDINIDLLTGSNTKKQKEKIVKNLESGQTNIIIGTHALIEDDVKFKNLGLAIIDEQHRFGVIQRLKLVEKGEDTDTLLMSATPIPRSLMMGLFGDMDISILDEKPQNRQEIETLVMSETKEEQIIDGIKRAIAKKEKIYWICPAIEESEESDEINEQKKLTPAVTKFEKLSTIFGEQNVALLHGKMKDKEKNQIMDDFKNGPKMLLVSTTVIEVGVDVSDATIMVIENAEHFGLASLHQLRGRVGRGDKKSFCILLYGKFFGKIARQRLNILKDSNDGFFIAEQDLKIRGSGQLLGTRQSGLEEFRIADLAFDYDLLNIASKQAKMILSKDQKLQDEKYQNLLKLFNFDECLKMILSG